MEATPTCEGSVGASVNMLEPGRHPLVRSLDERLGVSSLSEPSGGYVAARISMRGIGGAGGFSSGTGDLDGSHFIGFLVAQNPFMGLLVKDIRRGDGAVGPNEG